MKKPKFKVGQKAVVTGYKVAIARSSSKADYISDDNYAPIGSVITIESIVAREDENTYIYWNKEYYHGNWEDDLAPLTKLHEALL